MLIRLGDCAPESLIIRLECWAFGDILLMVTGPRCVLLLKPTMNTDTIKAEGSYGRMAMSAPLLSFLQ